MTLTIGAMLASATGISNPVKAFAIVVDNSYITFFVSAFIVMGVVAVIMVANIIPPTYVITLLTKLNYKTAVVVTGLLALFSFPWVLVKRPWNFHSYILRIFRSDSFHIIN